MPDARALDPRTWTLAERLHALVLAGLVAGAVGHSLTAWTWYIEDAAISMAFAENVAAGRGAVVQPGMDRLEGYSNPTWVALMVVLRLLGLPLFDVMHGVQAVLTIATVLAVWAGGRELFGRRSWMPLVPPAFLAANAQFALWNQAGLENSLWNLLFALGLWRTAVELRDEPPAGAPATRFPWSAALWLGLSLTRPEGILYAAVAGATHLAWHLVERRTLRRTAEWLLVFFVPWTIYQVVHYWYFAWAFPNTYYAKMAIKELGPLSWNKRSWNWTRNFFLDLGQAAFLPIWLLGIVGQAGWRRYAAGAAFVVLAVAIELSGSQRHLLPATLAGLWLAFWAGLRWSEPVPPQRMLLGALVAGVALFGASEAMRQAGFLPNQLPVSDAVKAAPPYLLVAAVPLLTVLGAGQARWAIRMLVWLACWCAIAFAVYSNGDWMKGYRWFAMASVPGAFLFAWGAEALGAFLDEVFGAPDVPEARRPAAGERPGPIVAAVVALALVAQLPSNIAQTVKVAADFDPSPRAVKPRIDFVRETLARVGWDEPAVVVDVDMGAHLLWTDWRMLDIAGLVDIAFAHHKFERPFVREYLFQEQRPPVLHIHGGWSTTSRIPSHPEFREGWYEIPGFPAGKQFHIGNYLRRDLLVKPDASGLAGDPIRFAEGVELWPPRVRAEPGPDRRVSIDVGMRAATKLARRDRKTDDFRVLLFAARDGAIARTWDLPPAWELMPPHDWKPGEVFVGPVVLSTTGLEPGVYDLGLVVLREDGVPLAPESVPVGVVAPIAPTDADPVGVPAVYAATEVRFPGALEVLTVEARGERATAEREGAIADAGAGDCAGAEVRWRRARDHRAGEEEWVATHQPPVLDALAACWARASDAGEVSERVRALLRARRWRWDHPEVLARAAALADAREAAGAAARAEEDWETAYRAYADAADLDGDRAWARRRAEEARGERLGIADGPQASADGEDALRRKQRKGFMIGEHGELQVPRFDERAPRPPGEGPPPLAPPVGAPQPGDAGGPGEGP